MTALAVTPEPPYYAVIFTTVRGEADEEYERTARRMEQLAAAQPGYLGIESVGNPGGMGVTISYWRDLDAIRRWRDNLEHCEAREQSRERHWYRSYQVRVALVERDYCVDCEGGRDR